MAYKNIKKILSSSDLIAQVPLSKSGETLVKQHRTEIKDILSGKDNRLLVVLGPGSAWPTQAMLTYAAKIKELEGKVRDKLKLVLRIYIQRRQKRSSEFDGIVNHPDPLINANVELGMLAARKLMVEIVEMDVAIADEAMFTHNAHGFSELLAYTEIGARSSEDQEHRIHASALDTPVGMKNPLYGSFKTGLNSVVSAQHPHTAIFDSSVIETSGNHYAHVVLGGCNDQTNCGIDFFIEYVNYTKTHPIQNHAIIVDAADNAIFNDVVDYKRQQDVVLNVVKQLKDHSDYKHLLKGFMLDSFLKDGKQNIVNATHLDDSGISITNPCIDFATTEKLLLSLCDNI